MVFHAMPKKEKKSRYTSLYINSRQVFPGFASVANRFAVLFSVLITFSQRYNSGEFSFLVLVFPVLYFLFPYFVRTDCG